MTARPFVHFTPARDWMNDPNGLVFHAGEYHLFYQHNPFADVWGHMSWGHAVSRDLIHWDHLPVALTEEDGVMIFSGCAVVDHENTSGFGASGAPPLVAIYTGHTEHEQNQNIAYSRDLGRSWTKYPGNPVIAIGSREFRDPKVIWHAPTRRWIMITVLADRHQVRFDGSPDLIHWEHLSDYGPFGADDAVWECPDLFPIAVEDSPDETVWAIKVDVCRSVGAQMIFGHFDGRGFTPLTPEARAWRVDHGVDFYAAQSWSDMPDGRRIWIAWMSNWHYAHLTPTTGWRGVCSIPRELTVRRTPDGLRPAQRPIRELQGARAAGVRLDLADVDEANAALAALDPHPAVELALTADVGGAKQFGLRIRHGQAAMTEIVCDVAACTLSLDRRRSGESSFFDGFAAVHTAPLILAGGRLRLHVLLDTCTVEVLADDGLVALSDLIFPHDGLMTVELFADGEPVIRSLDLWTLRSLFSD